MSLFRASTSALARQAPTALRPAGLRAALATSPARAATHKTDDKGLPDPVSAGAHSSSPSGQRWGPGQSAPYALLCSRDVLLAPPPGRSLTVAASPRHGCSTLPRPPARQTRGPPQRPPREHAAVSVCRLCRFGRPGHDRLELHEVGRRASLRLFASCARAARVRHPSLGSVTDKPPPSSRASDRRTAGPHYARPGQGQVGKQRRPGPRPRPPAQEGRLGGARRAARLAAGGRVRDGRPGERARETSGGGEHCIDTTSD